LQHQEISRASLSAFAKGMDVEVPAVPCQLAHDKQQPLESTLVRL
jgi:hypothetical protein